MFFIDVTSGHCTVKINILWIGRIVKSIQSNTDYNKNHRRSWHGPTTPLFSLTICLHLDFHVYSQCAIYYHIHILNINTIVYGCGRHMQFDVNIRLYEYWHEQVKIRKKRWNNKEIKNNCNKKSTGLHKKM
jgi:hypothetical protein